MKLGSGAALAVAVALGSGPGACGRSPDADAFAAAKDAVASTPGAPAHPGFDQLKARHLTGLKGSHADVVCGAVTSGQTDTPFVYVWKLKPAVPDPGRRQGEVMLLSGPLDRHAANLFNHFCSDEPQTSAANPYDYFS